MTDRPLRVLFFSMHGGAAVEITELCRAAGVRLDIAGERNRIVTAATTAAEHARLKSVGVGAPTDVEIRTRLRQHGYDAVIVTTDRQIKEFEENIRPIEKHVPLVVRHGNNIFAELKKLNISNFMSPSARALAIMDHCNQFHSRKLFNWDWLPSPDLDVDQREGFAAYIHHYKRFWPDAFRRMEEVNRLLAPERIIAYGNGNADGTIDDLSAMSRSRATVHIKDGAICCFAGIRSMAMGTPVVLDRLSHERCFFDSTSGLIVRNDAKQIAAELRRLAQDDNYWLERSKFALTEARRQFTCDANLASRFVQFLQRAKSGERNPK